ncbi:MAG: indolepyruvate oxidoreductase subunit beta [Nitrospirota bacterium]
MKEGNIIFCGVGGQGILLASEITSYALMKTGFDVKKSEVHGMAQRGGAVVAHLRYGEKVFSPLIGPGSVDIQVAFEMLESLRYLEYLGTSSRVIVNTQKILPSPVATGVETYHSDVIGQLKGLGLTVFPVDAFEIAKMAGEIKAVSMVLVGALSCFLPAGEDVFYSVIEERVPERFRKANLEAFAGGRKAITDMNR